MFRQTDYFKWVSGFKSNTVKNDTSLYEESIWTKRLFFSITVLCILTLVFSMIASLHWLQCAQWWSSFVDYYIYTDWLFQMSNQFQIQYYLEWQLSLRRNHINQAFILFNYCTLYINFSVFNDCLLTLTVMFSMMVYFRGLLYLHWLTISNEYPVWNPILLRMTALFTKKAYKPSVSSFQLLYSVH